jgi:hypothetical protein
VYGIVLISWRTVCPSWVVESSAFGGESFAFVNEASSWGGKSCSGVIYSCALVTESSSCGA